MPSVTVAGPAEMANLARSLAGKTLAQLQAGPMSDRPYGRYAGAWCAVFATWLTRTAGVPYKTYAIDAYNACTHVETPQIGDLIYYPTVGHVGVVVGVHGSSVETVEGNTPGPNWVNNYVKHYVNAWNSNHVFSRPDWTSSASGTRTRTEEDDMIRIVSYSADNPRNGVAIAGPGYWHLFTPEEFKYWSDQGLFANIPVVTQANDHAYDLLHDIFTKSSPITTT